MSKHASQSVLARSFVESHPYTMTRPTSTTNAIHMYQTSHARWTAVSQRDPAAHCSFLYGVKTTRIYCRPTCTARLARRANVVYYDSIEQARRDGFRACQRCRPDDVAFFGQREEAVVSALEILRVKQSEETVKWSIKELAKDVGVTPSYLCRVFKKTMGMTIGEYMKQFEVPMVEGLPGESMRPSGVADLGLGSSESQSPSSATVSSCSPSDHNYVPFCNATGIDTAFACDPLLSVTTDDPVLPGAPFSSNPTLPVSLNEENFDLNFDFDEWVWTEGFNSGDMASCPVTTHGSTPS